MVEEKTDILLNKLQEGKIDAAFLALPVEADNLIYHEIFKDEFLLTVYRSHPLAKKKSIIYQDLKNETLLLLEEGHCMRNQALQLCNISGIRENNNFRATSLETLRQTVISGSGITLIPAIAALPNKNLVYIKFKAPKPERTIAFITRKSSPKLEIFEKISNLCKTK